MSEAREGYDHDFSKFDALTEPLRLKAAEKFGAVKYRNWYPFRSPKGAWMAFHNTAYSDIRIINLDTMEVVVDGEFYAHLERDEEGKPKWRDPKTVYASHTNSSTYVPSFIEYEYEGHDGKRRKMCMQDSELDDDDPEGRYTLDAIRSVPLAFNAWTIWAADYEFYVDVIDLSKVDDGKVSLLKLGTKHQGMSIPIEARHVRNYIKANSEHWIQLANKEKGIEAGQVEHITFDAQILTESHLGRMDIGGKRGFHDIYAEKGEAYEAGPLPWQTLKQRWIDSGYYKGDDIPQAISTA